MSPTKKKTTRKRKKSTKARSRKRKAANPVFELKPETKRQIHGYVQIALAAILLLVLQGNAGLAGDGVRSVVVFFFGKAGILLPIGLALSGLFLLFRNEGYIELRGAIGLSLCIVAILGVIHVQAPFHEIRTHSDQLAGAIGFIVAMPLLGFTSLPVAYVVLSAVFLIGLLVTFELSIADAFRSARSLIQGEAEEEEKVTKKRVATRKKEAEESGDLLESGMHRGEEEVGKGRKKKSAEINLEDQGINIIRPSFGSEEFEKKEIKKSSKIKKKVNDEDIEVENKRFDDWEFPSFDCLDPSRSEVMVDDETLQKQALRIAQKLKEFDVNVTMRDAHPGPTVTQFTLEPSQGVKLSRIANLKNDLALALAASSLRIEAPIPGKALVGLEMPNEKRTVVHLRELLESSEFRQTESPLSLPFGRDVAGKAIIQDLAEMPHLLIAGATGSGKSVCMNTFLISLLFQNAPHELRFILIDPKRVELAPYDGIPHLLTPVITEAERALKALRWVVAEMGRRLVRFSEVNCRNLQEFNDAQDNEEKQLPRIVVVIDELADLMMRQYRRDTETMITRIAQIARATGIHLILATQRPSVDVITGIIKANIPTRIAFRTVSSIDSRTILDSIGSEDLLGKGDMLYTHASTPNPARVQGIYVSGKEVERVINQVKIAGGGQLTSEINMGSEEDDEDGEQVRGFGDTNTPYQGQPGPVPTSGNYGEGEGDIDLDSDDDGGDDLTFEAIELVRRSGKASASLLQRHLKVGYARAARILDILEEKGIVGPADGAKPRKVYIDTVSC